MQILKVYIVSSKFLNCFIFHKVHQFGIPGSEFLNYICQKEEILIVQSVLKFFDFLPGSFFDMGRALKRGRCLFVFIHFLIKFGEDKQDN